MRNTGLERNCDCLRGGGTHSVADVHALINRLCQNSSALVVCVDNGMVAILIVSRFVIPLSQWNYVLIALIVLGFLICRTDDRGSTKN